jgi:hypothetical protein
MALGAINQRGGRNMSDTEKKPEEPEDQQERLTDLEHSRRLSEIVEQIEALKGEIFRLSDGSKPATPAYWASISIIGICESMENCAAAFEDERQLRIAEEVSVPALADVAREPDPIFALIDSARFAAEKAQWLSEIARRANNAVFNAKPCTPAGLAAQRLFQAAAKAEQLEQLEKILGEDFPGKRRGLP